MTFRLKCRQLASVLGAIFVGHLEATGIILLLGFISLLASTAMFALATKQMTADQLASLPDDGNRRELVDGVLHMMPPAGGRHGRIAGRLFLRIGNHVEQGRLGEVFATETGYLLSQDPDTVRAPDVTFVSSERLGEFADYAGYLPLAPDLAAEVVPPSHESSKVESKAKNWLQAGVRVVLVVDPQTKSIREYRSPSETVSTRTGPSTYGISCLSLSSMLPSCLRSP